VSAKTAVKRFYPITAGIRYLCATAINQTVVNKQGDHMRYSLGIK